jgi:hypothetical protein
MCDAEIFFRLADDSQVQAEAVFQPPRPNRSRFINGCLAKSYKQCHTKLVSFATSSTRGCQYRRRCKVRAKEQTPKTLRMRVRKDASFLAFSPNSLRAAKRREIALFAATDVQRGRKDFLIFPIGISYEAFSRVDGRLPIVKKEPSDSNSRNSHHIDLVSLCAGFNSVVDARSFHATESPYVGAKKSQPYGVGF